MKDEMKTYGIWSVKTEGDCECRTWKQLGFFEGTISDIALYLADQREYNLWFTKCEFTVDPKDILKPGIPTKNTTTVSVLDYKNNTVPAADLISDINSENQMCIAEKKYSHSNTVSITLKV